MAGMIGGFRLELQRQVPCAALALVDPCIEPKFLAVDIGVAFVVGVAVILLVGVFEQVSAVWFAVVFGHWFSPWATCAKSGLLPGPLGPLGPKPDFIGFLWSRMCIFAWTSLGPRPLKTARCARSGPSGPGGPGKILF